MGGDKGEWSKFPQLNGPKIITHLYRMLVCVGGGRGGGRGVGWGGAESAEGTVNLHLSSHS